MAPETIEGMRLTSPGFASVPANFTVRADCAIWLSPGSIAVARCIQGISPKHCTSPARRAE